MFITKKKHNKIVAEKDAPKMKPKYNIGDTVWYITDNKVNSGDITGVYLEKDKLYYTTARGIIESHYSFGYSFNLKEENIFPTKQTLIDSL